MACGGAELARVCQRTKDLSPWQLQGPAYSCRNWRPRTLASCRPALVPLRSAGQPAGAQCRHADSRRQTFTGTQPQQHHTFEPAQQLTCSSLPIAACLRSLVCNQPDVAWQLLELSETNWSGPLQKRLADARPHSLVACGCLARPTRSLIPSSLYRRRTSSAVAFSGAAVLSTMPAAGHTLCLQHHAAAAHSLVLPWTACALQSTVQLHVSKKNGMLVC